MPELFIDGRPVQAQPGQTVLQAARAAGVVIPTFCWHPQLSVPGNCRVCVVEVEAEGGGNGWLDIACNMPVTTGMHVLTDSPRVRQRRQETLQFLTLNHPVDCGICDKAGECTLQDHHAAWNGERSISREPKLRGDKHHRLSPRVVLDEERCILCTRCVRFTHEVSGSHGLGVMGRGDDSRIRAVEDGSFARDAYSDNVIDLCPVGALLSPAHLHGTRVWFLQATPSVCPGCSRGCRVSLWHRRPSWQLLGLDTAANHRIERVTPLQRQDSDEPLPPNGPWICNWARDLPGWLQRPRALQPLCDGVEVPLESALHRARTLLAAARRPVAVVSSAASNEELEAFARHLGARCITWHKADRQTAPGELLEDAVLVTADKNPNAATAARLGPPLPEDAAQAFPPGCDLVLVWGEGLRFSLLPAGVPVVLLASWLQAENGHATVCLPISLHTERSGHFTNRDGVVSAFEAAVPPPLGVLHAQDLFAALAEPQRQLLEAPAA